ncbi:MAG: monovalent cation/H(+) antiporter subunit G [Actinomycetota bacterium]
MTALTQLLLLTGSALSVLAGIGLLRFATPYARFHAAGKASPVAFLLVALAAGIALGPAASARLAFAAVALVLTLPVGVHLLFRAVHRTGAESPLATDELAAAQRRSPKSPH